LLNYDEAMEGYLKNVRDVGNEDVEDARILVLFISSGDDVNASEMFHRCWGCLLE
jgi:hypothetical protein